MNHAKAMNTNVNFSVPSFGSPLRRRIGVSIFRSRARRLGHGFIRPKRFDNLFPSHFSTEASMDRLVSCVDSVATIGSVSSSLIAPTMMSSTDTRLAFMSPSTRFFSATKIFPQYASVELVFCFPFICLYFGQNFLELRQARGAAMQRHDVFIHRK